MRTPLLFATLLALTSAGAWADQAEEAVVRSAIAKLAPGAEIESLQPAAMPGMYAASVGGTEVYVSADGKFLMNGALWDVNDKKNLTEAARSVRRKDALAQIGPEQRIIFSPENPRHHITVFTDLDCGYCRKLHESVQAYNDAGISVEYLLFPRGGLDSPSYTAAVSVWCADDRRAALTSAKRGQAPEPRICPNPVRDEFLLGQRIGVSSTPTIVTEDGALLLGYIAPAQLLAQLDATQP
jgi:thiol:disulfide interchange protein DsbC